MAASQHGRIKLPRHHTCNRAWYYKYLLTQLRFVPCKSPWTHLHSSCFALSQLRTLHLFTQTVNAKELFGFLPHQTLEVYTGTIHAKKCCKKVVLYFLIPYFELRIFSGVYRENGISSKPIRKILQGVWQGGEGVCIQCEFRTQQSACSGRH